MKSAIITDIHGNRYALEAVLDDIAQQRVDGVICAGDYVNLHPFSKDCWEILRDLGCPMVQGNHEYYLYTINTPDADPKWKTSRYRMLDWHQSQFTQVELDTMRALPMTYEIDNMIVTHASLRGLFDNLFPDTSSDALNTFFPTEKDTFIFRGHNHGWQAHHWVNRHGANNTVVTINALGMPYDGELGAPYAIVTKTATGWQYEKRAVQYDRMAAIRAFDETYLAEVGGMAKLAKLGLQTAENQIIPFLKQFMPRINRGELDFERAVDIFLARRKS